MNLEEKRNKLNLELRMILSLIDMIDGVERKYLDYNSETNMTEDEYIEQQLLLAVEARDRLVRIFKD